MAVKFKCSSLTKSKSVLVFRETSGITWNENQLATCCRLKTLFLMVNSKPMLFYRLLLRNKVTRKTKFRDLYHFH